MPHLQIKDCPEDVYRRLLLVAEKEKRSVAEQALLLLEKGIEEELSNVERRRLLLETLCSRRIPPGLREVDVVSLLREDRER